MQDYIESLLILFVSGDMKSVERGKALLNALSCISVFPNDALKVLKEKEPSVDNYLEYYLHKSESIDFEILLALLSLQMKMDYFDGGYSEVLNDFITSGKLKELVGLLETKNEVLKEYIDNNITWEDWCDEQQ